MGGRWGSVSHFVSLRGTGSESCVPSPMVVTQSGAKVAHFDRQVVQCTMSTVTWPEHYNCGSGCLFVGYRKK